jgi:hypothetical protein
VENLKDVERIIMKEAGQVNGIMRGWSKLSSLQYAILLGASGRTVLV